MLSISNSFLLVLVMSAALSLLLEYFFYAFDMLSLYFEETPLTVEMERKLFLLISDSFSKMSSFLVA